jgi:hypothetical protein
MKKYIMIITILIIILNEIKSQECFKTDIFEESFEYRIRNQTNNLYFLGYSKLNQQINGKIYGHKINNTNIYLIYFDNKPSTSTIINFDIKTKKGYTFEIGIGRRDYFGSLKKINLNFNCFKKEKNHKKENNNKKEKNKKKENNKKKEKNNKNKSKELNIRKEKQEKKECFKSIQKINRNYYEELNITSIYENVKFYKGYSNILNENVGRIYGRIENLNENLFFLTYYNGTGNIRVMSWKKVNNQRIFVGQSYGCNQNSLQYYSFPKNFDFFYCDKISEN